MRVFVVAILTVLTAFAGCADEGTVSKTDGPMLEIEVDEYSGALCGVVVDETIVPVFEAQVSIDVEGQVQEQFTDAEGRFCFGKLPPGTYVVEVSKPAYESVQASWLVEAGLKNPPLLKVQIARLFDEDPFVEAFHFAGRLACHVQAGLTAPCVTDYTQLVPGCGSGCVPELRTIMGDARDFIYEVRAGWQSHIVEMTWDPSTSATSSHMGMIIRDFEVGGGSHQFGAMSGQSPLWIHLKEGEVHPTQAGGEPTMIPGEGYDQIIHFAGVRGGGEPVAAAIEQDFEVITHTFYYASAPEEWSIIAGDEVPF